MSKALRHMVRLERDEAPDGADAPDYQTLIDVLPCFIEEVGGEEQWKGKQLEAGIRYQITSSHNPEFGRLEGSMRMVGLEAEWEGMVLNITHANVKRATGRDAIVVWYAREAP